MSVPIWAAASADAKLKACGLANNVLIRAYLRRNQTAVSDKTAGINENHDWFSGGVGEERRELPAIGADGVHITSEPRKSSLYTVHYVYIYI